MYAELSEQISQMRARLRRSINNLCNSRPDLYWPPDIEKSAEFDRDPRSRSMDSLLWQQRINGDRGNSRYVSDWLKSVRSFNELGRPFEENVQDFGNFRENSVLHPLIKPKHRKTKSLTVVTNEKNNVQQFGQEANSSNSLLFSMTSLPSLAFGQVAAYGS